MYDKRWTRCRNLVQCGTLYFGNETEMPFYVMSFSDDHLQRSKSTIKEFSYYSFLQF